MEVLPDVLVTVLILLAGMRWPFLRRRLFTPCSTALRIAPESASGLARFEQPAAEVPHRARRLGRLCGSRCVAGIALRGPPAAGLALRHGTNWCWCWTGRRMRNSNCWIEEFHLFRQERTVPQDLPARGGPWVLPVARSGSPAGGGQAARAEWRTRMNAGVNAAQYPVIGLVDREADFIPEVLLRLIRPMLADCEHVVAVCGVAPPPPGAGTRGMYRRYRGAASVAGSLCRIQRVEQAAAGSRRLHAGETRCDLLGERIPCRAAGTVCGFAYRLRGPRPWGGDLRFSPPRSVSGPPRARGTICAASYGRINYNWRRLWAVPAPGAAAYSSGCSVSAHCGP